MKVRFGTGNLTSTIYDFRGRHKCNAFCKAFRIAGKFSKEDIGVRQSAREKKTTVKALYAFNQVKSDLLT